MQKIRNSFPFNISYEGGFLYILIGIILSLYNIKKNNINFIYSTYSPNSNHIIAYFLKLFLPKLIWIADFRDLPCGDSEGKIFFKKFQLCINKIIYSKANALVTVSSGIRDVMLKYNKNITVINNGFDKNVQFLKKTIHSNTTTFNIVYTGSLYGGKRDCSLLFQTIRSLLNKKLISEDIRLIYAGRDGNIWNYLSTQYNLDKYSENHGLLSMEHVQQLQKKAALFLMVTWSTKIETGILTGKFYEYLSYIKPIICLINGNKDLEIEKKFKEINCGKVVYSSSNLELEKFIVSNYKEWKVNKIIDSKYNYKELENYTSANLTKKLTSMFFKELVNE